jgi:hypothetical protein
MLAMPSRSRACTCEWCRSQAGQLTASESRALGRFLAAVAVRVLFSAEASPEWRLRRAFTDTRRTWPSDELFALRAAETKLGVVELPADRSFRALVDQVGLCVPRAAA